MVMRSGLEGLGDLRDDALDYVKLRWASIRLGAADRLSSAVSRVLGYVLAFTLVLFAVVFMMVALSLWIGYMLGHPALGFLICGGAFLIVGVVILFAGRNMFANSMVKYFVDLFFTDNDYRHGTKE
jgi:hypothetical protein